MKTLNGIVIFNATPHVIRFWCEGWEDLIEVPTDEVISAEVCEIAVPPVLNNTVEPDFQLRHLENVQFVNTGFVPTTEGLEVIKVAWEAGADVIVGSIIAAQAYPGQVVAMTPAPGYERVPPAEKRMNPYKFTTFCL